MMMRHWFLSSTLALLFAGCTVGPSAGTFRPAQQAAGIEVRAIHGSGEFQGELLTAQDSGLLVVSDRGVIFFLGYRELRNATFDQLSIRLSGGRAPSGSALKQLRRVSRYPQGVSPELLEQLLAAYGQAEVRRLPGGRDQAAAAAATDFLERVRAGTLRYQERTLAIAEGYRRIGPDFPGMGEHWVHLGRLMSGELDAERPQILGYATINGRPTLVGVAYAVPVAPGESPPEFPGAGWHYHEGTVMEESFLPHHHGLSRETNRGIRVAVVHAWVHLDNPAGVFGTDNWSLPFIRVGLEPPGEPRQSAAQALSLVSGGDRYYLESIGAAAALDDHARERVALALERSRDRVKAVLGARIASNQLSERDLGELGAVWADLWRSVRDVVGVDAERRFSHLRETMR